MLRKLFMQTLGNPQLKLPGIFFHIIWLANLNSLFKSSFQPCFFCVDCIGCSSFQRFATSNTTGKIRIRCNIAALLRIRNNFQPVRKSEIFN